MTRSKKLSVNNDSVVAFMPIKPIYAEKLIKGEKKYEFRKTAIRSDLSHIIIYATSPVKKIIGIAEIKGIQESSPTATWDMTKHVAGISRKLFREYFKGKKRAYAIQIKEVYPFSRAIDPSEIKNGFKIPQSFSYVNIAFFQKVLRKGQGKKGKQI